MSAEEAITELATRFEELAAEVDQIRQQRDQDSKDVAAARTAVAQWNARLQVKASALPSRCGSISRSCARTWTSSAPRSSASQPQSRARARRRQGQGPQGPRWDNLDQDQEAAQLAGLRDWVNAFSGSSIPATSCRTAGHSTGKRCGNWAPPRRMAAYLRRPARRRPRPHRMVLRTVAPRNTRPPRQGNLERDRERQLPRAQLRRHRTKGSWPVTADGQAPACGLKQHLVHRPSQHRKRDVDDARGSAGVTRSCPFRAAQRVRT
jgi:hypothetical protein